MAKKRRPPSLPAPRTVTADRAARLYRLLQFLARGPRTREALRRAVRLDVRGFYRDLELLRASSIPVTLENSRYSLQQSLRQAISLLPFPDPALTLGEAVVLAKGRTPAHRKLKQQVKEITG